MKKMSGIYGSIRMNKELYIQKFLELYNSGLNDCEIGKELGISGTTITDWRHKYNLLQNFSYIDRRKFDREEALNLHNQGFNYSEIARKLNVSSRTVCSVLNSMNCQSHAFDRTDYIPTYEEEQILIGGIYGDSYLGFASECINAHFSFAHSLKQMNYALWKYEKLKRFCVTPKKEKEFDKRNGNTYERISVRSTVFPFLTKMYPYFYKDKVKYINPEMLYKLDGLGLAIWFQDDGYYCHTSYAFSTNCFSLDDLKIVSDFFKTKFDIEIKIHKDHVIRMLHKDTDKFRNLVLPYMHKDCIYKLHLDSFKTPLNSETPIMDNTVLNLLETKENAERLDVKLSL